MERHYNYVAKYRNYYCISTESLVPFLFTPPLPIYHQLSQRECFLYLVYMYINMPKGLNKLNIGGDAKPECLLLGYDGELDRELFTPKNMIHARCLVGSYMHAHISAQYSCRQLAVE